MYSTRVLDQTFFVFKQDTNF